MQMCPLPGPLYTVLMGYKEAPVAEARARFGPIVRSLIAGFLPPTPIASPPWREAGRISCCRFPRRRAPAARPSPACRGWPPTSSLHSPACAGRGCCAGPANPSGTCTLCPRLRGSAYAPLPRGRPAPRPARRHLCERRPFPERGRGPPARRGLLGRHRCPRPCPATGPGAGPRRIPRLRATRRRPHRLPARAGRAPAAFRRRRARNSGRRSALRTPPTARAASSGSLARRDGRTTRGGPNIWKAPAGPMYCPLCTCDDVAAHNTGRAPPAADWPRFEPASRLSRRRTRLLLPAAPVPARLLRVQPGCAASAMVRKPPASRRRLNSATKRRLASFVVLYWIHELRDLVVARSSRPDPAQAVHVRAHRDDAGSLGRHQPVQEQPGQREVAQMVRRHLQLDAVVGLAVRRAHHAGVVDEEVEARVLLHHPFGRGAHRGQVRQVEVEQLEGAPSRAGSRACPGPEPPSPGHGRP